MKFFKLSFIFFIILLSCKGLKEQAGELPSDEEATILSLQEEAAGMKHFSIVIWEKQ
jgi:hypothetical protein